MSEPVLVVEYVGLAGDLHRGTHPGGRHSVHDRTLSVIGRLRERGGFGEIAGYADRVWRRYWYEDDPE